MNEASQIELRPEEQVAIGALKGDPKDSKAVYALNSMFWRTVEEIAKSGAGGGKNPELVLGDSRALLDFGVVEESLIEEDSPARPKLEKALKETQTKNEDFFPFSQWLRKQYQALLNFSRKQDIQRNIEVQEKEMLRVETEVTNLQRARHNMYSKCARDVSTRRGGGQALLDQQLARLEHFARRDGMLGETLMRKRSIARGVFMNLEEKRKHIQQEKDLENLAKRCSAALADLGNTVAETNLKKIDERIASTLARQVDVNERRRKYAEELSKITEETATLSPMEIEGRLSEEVHYLRDLIRLSANRLRVEPMSVLHAKADLVTREAIGDVMARIDEFDPGLHKNSRVAIFGKPAVVVIPGRGNGLYDWKNNVLIIPSMPYTSVEVSVISAVVEYRIDVDEEKKMMFSYNQIKDYAGIKSGWALRGKFVKDYTTWMVSEYMGYKIMPRTVREWFEHEIGPGKNAIFTPPQYAPFSMKPDEYEDLCNRLEVESTTDGANNAETWFGLGVVQANREQWEKAAVAFRKCVDLDSSHKEGTFNLAFSCSKAMMKQEAIDRYSSYIRLNPASWWAGVAREHLLRLR